MVHTEVPVTETKDEMAYESYIDLTRIQWQQLRKQLA